MDFNQTLNEIVSRLHKLGDLPVFSATVNQIRQLSHSEETDAMALAMAVMKDANLSVRVLKLANAPMFNPNNKQIASLSRAVVLLGFERILNLAMTIKLVESLRSDQSDKNLDRLLVQAFLNAAIARELADAAKLRKAEGVYLNGLLHNLGEILVAYTLPQRYERILSEWQKANTSWSEAQLGQLGAEFSDIGQEFAGSWGFPQSLVHSMDRYTATKLEGRDRSAHQIAVGSSLILAKLYSTGDDDSRTLERLFADFSEELNVRTDLIEDAVSQAYKLAAQLAEEVGLPTASLKPRLTDQADEYLEEFAEEVAFYLHSREQKQRAEELRSTPVFNAPVEPNRGLIEALSAYTKLIREEAPATKLIDAALSSVIDHSGLDNAIFLILAGKPPQLKVKLQRGKDASRVAAFLDAQSSSAVSRLLQAVCVKGTNLLITDTSAADWKGRLPEELVVETKAKGFILSGLSVGGKALGLIYLDSQSAPISDTDYAVFNQFSLLFRNTLEGRSKRKR